MNVYKKTIISIAFIILPLIGMEKDDFLDDKKIMLERKSSNPLNIMSKSSDAIHGTSPQKSSSEEPYIFSLSLPTLSSITSNLDSLKNTVTNYLSDDSAFIKLGWPLSNDGAKQELKKSQELYERVMRALQQKNISYETILRDHEKDFEAVNRRYDFCQRASKAFPTQSDFDGISFAKFCLRYHQQFIDYINTLKHVRFLEDKKVENKWKIPIDEKLIELEALIKIMPINIVKEDSNVICKTLGWPLTDTKAQEELQKSKDLYKRVTKCFETKVWDNSFLEDWKAIRERQDSCQQVLELLPIIFKRAEALDLATFCLKNHSQVMNDFDKSRFLLFVNMEQQKCKDEVKRANLDLAQLTIVPDDNELLKNLFEQTVSKYPKKIETTEPKKIDPKKDGKK